MGIYSSPPPPRAFYEDKPTLLVSWWCTIFAAVIILFRVCGRMVRTEKLFKEDKIALACLIPLFARMACVHVVLLWGTNNTTLEGLSDHDIWKREIGSRLVLLSRILYPATLWMLKLTISEFFKRLILQIWKYSYEITLQSIRWFLIITFVAVIIADLAECIPIQHYWQVRPDPGPRCRQGYAWLFTMGVSNVITDLLLIIFPIPIILRSRMPIKRKLQLVLLFSTSAAPVAVMLYQIPKIIEHHGLQQRRTLWASVEILFASAVANSLSLGSFVRDRGVKKQRWRYGSQADSVEREASRRGTIIQHWGSDEDLVRDVGISVDPEIRGALFSSHPRPAPMAVAGNTPLASTALNRDWQFPVSSDVDSDDSELVKEPESSHSHGEVALGSLHKVSFFDVGKLLDEDPRSHSLHTLNTQPSSSGMAPLESATTEGQERRGRGSSVLLQDIGGISPSSRTTRRESLQSPPPLLHRQSSEPVRSLHKKRPATTLYDIGGLLSKP